MKGWFRRHQTQTSPAPTAPPGSSDINIGLRDAALDGWFNAETGELFRGFPISRDDTVLDIGCGDGSKVSFCARQGAHVIFIDVNPERVSQAHARMASSGARALTPIVSNCDPLPLGDNVASKIVASEVLEHLDDPSRILRELYRVGRPGALYFFTVPDSSTENLQRQLSELPPQDYFERPNHIRIFSREEFIQVITDAGLVVESSGAHGFYSALWWIFLRACGGDLINTNHAPVNLWASTWAALLEMDTGQKVKAALDSALPKTQWIVARKP
jgi:SAM-dependent methyltransferase